MEEARGVLLTSKTDNDITIKTSGILLDGKWILTIGYLLSGVGLNTNYFYNNSAWKTLLKTPPDRLVPIWNNLLQKTQIDFTSVIPTGRENTSTSSQNCVSHRQDTKQILLSEKKQEDNVKLYSKQKVSSSISEKFIEYKADLRYTWRSRLMSETVHKLLDSWLLGSTTSGKEDSDTDAESEMTKQLLSLYLILKVNPTKETVPEKEDYEDIVRILRKLYENQEAILNRGQILVVESTPFANLLFFNSISEGIVSNIAGPGNCLILTDARTALGSEGGPMYVLGEKNGAKKLQLVGMVACTISWWKGEWMGFTLGVALQPALQGLRDLGVGTGDVRPIIPLRSSMMKLGLMDDCIVLVRCGSGWGSGMVLDSSKGIILTCSHVVRKCKTHAVQIFWKNNKLDADVLFRTSDGFAFDAAILKTSPETPFRQVTLSSSIPVRGEPVIAAGFPLFSEDDNSLPTVTRGIVAHVSSPLAMLQTTCCVQSGASGGAIFRTTGEVVGLISSNTHTSTGAIYPRINMAIPVCVLAAPLRSFLKSEDRRFLRALECSDPAVQQIWRLRPPVSKL